MAGLRNPPITALQKGLGKFDWVIVAGDRDVSGVGGEAANICADKMSSIGIRAQVSLPPPALTQDGTVITHDWADLLSEHVLSRVITHVEDIYQSTPPMSVAEAEAMGWCPDEPVWRDKGFVVRDVSSIQSEEK